MTTARRLAWPRRRTPWLRKRFGRGLLRPGMLGLRLRRTWAASPVFDRWRDRSTPAQRSEHRSSVALSVRLSVTGERGAGQPVAMPVRDVMRPSVTPRAVLAARNLSHPPVAVVARDAKVPARLDALRAGSIRLPVRAGRTPAQGSEPQAMLVAAAPPRVLIRSPQGEPSAPGGREPSSLRREPAARSGPGPEAEARPPDIERLTESVMAAIDRRLRSHRERMGRR